MQLWQYRLVVTARSPVGLRPIHPTKHPRIWHPYRYYVTTEANTKHHQINPLRTIIHPNIPPQRQPYKRTVRH